MPRPFIRFEEVVLTTAATEYDYIIPSNTESLALTAVGGNVEMYNDDNADLPDSQDPTATYESATWPLASGEKESFDRRVMDTIIGETLHFTGDADGAIVKIRRITKYTV
jgi:hypothetical protein